MIFQTILNKRAELAETPFWDDKTASLYWTDLFCGAVHRYDPGTGIDEEFHTGKQIGCAIPCTSGKVLCVLEDGLYKLDPSDGSLDLFLPVEADRPDFRFNDAGCDALGRLFISSTPKCYGTPDFKPEMKGSFYMVDRDLSVETVVPEMEHYNGICFSKDNKTMYVVDSYGFSILAFPYDMAQGPCGKPETAVKVPKEYFAIDGLAIDEEDNLYLAAWSGWILKYDPVAGELLDRIELSCPFVSCPGFGGDDRKDFYVTTSTWGYGQAELDKYPDAGGILLARSEVPGRIDYYFQD
ncbi:MAG: SMP-30/gluconolactonase/LRE family protein [Clostridiales bacterium]|nr:SMP-30/gluconolactonase/LRE family protein [Clostridiales bacterium]